MTDPDPKALRLAKGLTQAQVAAAAGISEKTVRTAEQAGRWPRLQRRIRDALSAALSESKPAS
jgi:transcriptional regulator with XRE-family HTH domain